MKRRIFFAILSVGFAILTMACQKIGNSPDLAGSAAVTVNGVAISKEALDLLAKDVAVTGSNGKQAEPQEILDHLVMQSVLSQAALKQGLDKVPGFAVRVDLLKQSALAAAYVSEYRKKNPVTDEMLLVAYEKMKEASSKNVEYKIQHILVSTEKEAREIILKLKTTPSAFGMIAKERSLDQVSKVKDGDLGWADAADFVPEFADALVNLEKGQMTFEPVKTKFGYHVIQLNDTRASSVLPLKLIKAKLKQQVEQQNLVAHLNALRAAAEVVTAAPPAASTSASK